MEVVVVNEMTIAQLPILTEVLRRKTELFWSRVKLLAILQLPTSESLNKTMNESEFVVVPAVTSCTS